MIGNIVIRLGENMKDLKSATLEELQEEIERRKKVNRCPLPLLQDEVAENLLKLKQAAIEDVENHFKGKDDDDSDHYMWEAVIEAVYGKKIWDWWNKE